MRVDEVGTGVGYVTAAEEPRARFKARGRTGEEENGSKAGSRDAAGLFTPAMGRTGLSRRLGDGLMAAVQDRVRLKHEYWVVDWLGDEELITYL